MKKILLATFIFIVICVTIYGAGSMPFVLNTLKQKAEIAVTAALGVPLKIGSLKGNVFHTLELHDANVDSVVMLRKCVVTYDVFKLLSKKIEIRNLSFEGLFVNINDLEKLSTKSEQKGQQEESRFSIHIKNVSFEKSNLFGIVNNTPLNAAVQLNGSLTPLHAVIDTLIIQTEHSTLSGHGTIPLADSDSLDIAYQLDLLLDEVPVEHLSGRLQSTGLLTGGTKSPRIEAQVAFTAQYEENEFSGTSMVQWQMPLLDSLFINAHIDARMKPLAQDSKKKEVWQAQLATQGQKFLGTIASPYGTLNLSGHYEGDINNPVIVADVNAIVSYKQLAPKVRADIGFQDHMVTIKNLLVQDQRVTLHANASMSTAQPQRITADMTIESTDISFLSSLIENVQPLNGKASIAARATGTITNPNINATVRINDATAYNETATAADFTLAFQSEILSVSEGRIQSPRGELDITGQYRIADSAFTIRLHSDSLHLMSPEVWGADTIPLSGTIGLDAQINGTVNNPRGIGSIYFDSISYDTLRFDDHKLDFSLQNQRLDLILTNKKQTMNITGTMKTVAPYEFGALITMDEFAVERFVAADTARLTGTVSVEGRMNDLGAITGNTSMSRLVYSKEGYRFENKDTLIVKLEDSKLHFDAFEVAVQGQTINIRGYVPLDFQEGTFDLICSAERFDITPLIALVPDAPEAKGFLSVNAIFTGTLQEPEISGELSLHDGAFTVPDVMLDSINGNISFQRDVITIEQLTGKVNRGTFNTRGQIQLKKEKLDLMSLETVVKKAEYRNNEYGRYVVSGELKTSARHDSIFLAGDITVDDGVYDIPFNVQTIIRLLTSVNRPAPEQAEVLKQIYCDVGITARDGVRIKNNVADVTADVDLQVRGTLARINVYGRITTPQTGTIRYLGKKFDIVNATIEFDNPYTVDPVLNLEATTFVSSIDGDYDITLQLSGTIENWRLALSSNPPAPEQDIISLVLIGRRRPTTEIATGGEGFNLQGTARDYALDLARGNIERTAEKTLGLDKVTVTGDLLAPRDLSIGIEKKLSRRLTLVYGTGIESWELHRIGFNYDITDNLSIFTLHDQENLNSSVDLDIHLDLK
ncbi:hypothetical protein AMJ87_06950 [candidate division WOR_3 bacterium SM23_60]|uniref:Translocation and assembly module TamB C-terminal domain-containing protein n=1 Tax=candidate division WOR_3 bacterium SM23_60 TaxID=1703780 RepID=A0A0S8GF90_UNCW3|nr:MAG: hypothetical protein AMJ87_06950 [candidate division WOR_3 bacterium SM23_60]